MKYIKTNFVYSPCPTLTRHIHEIQGNVDAVEDSDYSHTHNFISITDEAIPIGSQDHIHEVRFKTDTYENHSHEFSGKTTGAIPIGDRHVHFLKSETTSDADHKHTFSLVTFLDNTIND